MRHETTYRFATPSDASAIAPLNAQLIRDEEHRNSMSLSELRDRMRAWLESDYRAVLFEVRSDIAGYALYRLDPEYVYLRQLFVAPAFRRQGIGRAALAWLWQNAWDDAPRLRIDVLIGNTNAQAFWRAVGLKEYCLMMEMSRPAGPPTPEI